jgi:Leucine-rich repeat (LRR) protein
MPKLEELYLASNAVSNIIGWDSLPSLKRLHLRKNKIEKIDEELPPLDALVYLNLRGNKLSTLD